ncbi:MAG: tellurium resistance protein TerA [Cyanobacteriota bacterium]|nr:tellurium resistance protein TerA [Cyanobacteriota bacterium]
MVIKLEKTGDFHNINLSKDDSTDPVIVHVNLNWEAITNNRSGWIGKIFGSNSAPDLDLGCMYEMMNGQRGVIQPLGEQFGSRKTSPYIYLDKDDRTGQANDGENMYIFRPDLIQRILFFCFIYEGAEDFKSVRGRMFFKISNDEEVFLELNNPDSNCSFCAAALLKNINSQIMIVKEEKYFLGHKEADQFYQYGFNWVSGRK